MRLGDKAQAFEDAYGDQIMGVLNELGMLAESTLMAQDPAELGKWEQSLSSLIRELNGDFEPLPVPPRDLAPTVP